MRCARLVELAFELLDRLMLSEGGGAFELVLVVLAPETLPAVGLALPAMSDEMGASDP